MEKVLNAKKKRERAIVSRRSCRVGKKKNVAMNRAGSRTKLRGKEEGGLGISGPQKLPRSREKTGSKMKGTDAEQDLPEEKIEKGRVSSHALPTNCPEGDQKNR